jgi:hypothetical protein
MSSGFYALVGVLVGGAITAGIDWWNSRRRAKADWLVASRLVSDELERLIADLRGMIEHRIVPPNLLPSFLDTRLWDEYRAVVARELKNDGSGDAFWRGLSRVNAAVGHYVRPALQKLGPGAALSPEMVVKLEECLDHAVRAYEALTGVALTEELTTSTPD